MPRPPSWCALPPPEAVGHGTLSPDELLSKYLNQQRPDVRGPGAGKDPLDDITSGAAKPAGAADAPCTRC